MAVTNQEMYDEAYRELQVRLRCYEKWVREGKLSRTDATSRLEGQQAIVIALAALDGVEAYQPMVTRPHPENQ